MTTPSQNCYQLYLNTITYDPLSKYITKLGLDLESYYKNNSTQKPEVSISNFKTNIKNVINDDPILNKAVNDYIACIKNIYVVPPTNMNWLWIVLGATGVTILLFVVWYLLGKYLKTNKVKPVYGIEPNELEPTKVFP